MIKRLYTQKIPDIRAVRSLTSLLGKMHIPSCYYSQEYWGWDSSGSGTTTTVQVYGLGLKEAKDYVESKYEYVLPQEVHNPRREIERGNMIHEIKRTRQLMLMLSRFGIGSADASLRPCKDFVARRRN